jgi:hypothetical protein
MLQDTNHRFGSQARPGWFRGYEGTTSWEHFGMTSDWAWMRWHETSARTYYVRDITGAQNPVQAGVMDDFGDLVPAVPQ